MDSDGEAKQLKMQVGFVGVERKPLAGITLAIDRRERLPPNLLWSNEFPQ
jgi:hypothetical protein